MRAVEGKGMNAASWCHLQPLLPTAVPARREELLYKGGRVDLARAVGVVRVDEAAQPVAQRVAGVAAQEVDAVDGRHVELGTCWLRWSWR